MARPKPKGLATAGQNFRQVTRGPFGTRQTDNHRHRNLQIGGDLVHNSGEETMMWQGGEEKRELGLNEKQFTTELIENE